VGAPTCGPEIAGELPMAELAAALPSLLPADWVCGVDTVTPNTVRVFARPRERCASLELDVGPGDFSMRDLEAGAKELSRRHGARVVLWDDWAATFFIELEAGEAIARLIHSHNGEYRGVDWRSFSTGAVPPPFPAELVPLFDAWRDGEFVEGLRRWQHGPRGARGEQVAQIFRRYLTREPSLALRAITRAALRRARVTGSAMLKGLGRVLVQSGDGGGRLAIRPARSLLRFFDGDGALALDFSSFATRLGAEAAAQAERDLTGALSAARDLRTDVVFPGLLCITTKQTPAVTFKNPRDGSTHTLREHRQPFFIFFDDATRAPARRNSPIQSGRS
jgi:hypothetical protein